MTEGMWDNPDYVPPVTTIVKKQTKKAMDVESEPGDRRQKFVDAVNVTDSRSASSSDRTPSDICSNLKNKKTYSKMSKKQASDLLP